MNRAETELALHRDRAWVLERWLSLSAAELEAPCTTSGADPDLWWTPKDHLCHLISVEKSFGRMVAAFVRGAADALDAAVPDRPRTTERGDMLSYVDRANDAWILRHRDKSVDELVRMGEQARSRTLELMVTIDDDQFELQIPNAPWSGGRVGDMLAHPLGEHGRRHWDWVLEGRAGRAGSPTQ